MLSSLVIDESFDEAEVDYANAMLSVFVVWIVPALADEDVVKLQVVVSEASLMDEPQLLHHSKADFDGTRKTERLVTLEQKFLKCVAVPPENHVRPNLRLEELNELVLGQLI